QKRWARHRRQRVGDRGRRRRDGDRERRVRQGARPETAGPDRGLGRGGGGAQVHGHRPGARGAQGAPEGGDEARADGPGGGERGVYFFLGRSWGAKGPGLIYVPPLFAKTQQVSLRVVALDIPPQDVITRDNISIKVNAVLYMRVKEPVKAVIGVENYLYATSQLAQTTLRSVLGETELDELLMNREKINNILK